MRMKKIKKIKNKLSEATVVDSSPGVKGYTAYTPTEKWASRRKELNKIIKKTTGYEMVGDKRIPNDTINVNDNPINKKPVNDKNVSPTKMEFNGLNESIGKKVTVKHIKKWMKSLDENKWRKTYNVDARRVAHFVNFGESVELPKSLQKRNKNANYDREANIAKRFLESLKRKMEEHNLRNMVRNYLKEIING
jgi:phage-related protein